MFVQMRVLMPVGFLTMFAALIVDRAGLNGEAMLAKLSGFPACLFFLAGALGMILMLVFTFRMDSSDPKVNWMEQTVNSLAQICFFIGLMLAWRSASKEKSRLWTAPFASGYEEKMNVSAVSMNIENESR